MDVTVSSNGGTSPREICGVFRMHGWDGVIPHTAVLCGKQLHCLLTLLSERGGACRAELLTRADMAKGAADTLTSSWYRHLATLLGLCLESLDFGTLLSGGRREGAVGSVASGGGLVHDLPLLRLPLMNADGEEEDAFDVAMAALVELAQGTEGGGLLSGGGTHGESSSGEGAAQPSDVHTAAPRLLPVPPPPR